MGATNTNSYTTTQNEISIICKAFGHPARIAIIQHLFKVNSCICNDVVNELSLAQPTISQHLRELKNAKLIKGTIEGKTVCYCIDKTGFSALKSFLETITLNIDQPDTNCC